MININIDYSETETLIVTYGDNKYDHFTDGDDLSSMIVKKLMKNTAHEYDGTNIIQIMFV